MSDRFNQAEGDYPIDSNYNQGTGRSAGRVDGSPSHQRGRHTQPDYGYDQQPYGQQAHGRQAQQQPYGQPYNARQTAQDGEVNPYASQRFDPNVAAANQPVQPQAAEQQYSRHRSRRDPSQGGWDPSISRADDSHKSHHSHHHRRRRKKKWPKVLAIVLIVVLVLVGVGIGSAAMFIRNIDRNMSFGDDLNDIKAALTATPNNDSFYVLVMGRDMREAAAASSQDKTSEPSRSDVIVLLRVDAKSGKMTMLTVPRDTPYMVNGEYNKLNEVYYTGGAGATIDAVEDLAGVHISHYAEISGTQLERLVDGLGGITVNVPTAIDATTITGNDVHLEPGLQRLNGAEALALANVRSVYSGNQDAGRQRSARLVMGGIVDAITSKPLYEIPAAVNDATTCAKTDMSATELIDVVRKMGRNVDMMSGSAPYDGGLDPWISHYADVEGNPWLCYVNTAGWERVIDVTNAGDDPSTVSYENDVVHYAGQPKETWSQGLVKP